MIAENKSKLKDSQLSFFLHLIYFHFSKFFLFLFEMTILKERLWDVAGETQDSEQEKAKAQISHLRKEDAQILLILCGKKQPVFLDVTSEDFEVKGMQLFQVRGKSMKIRDGEVAVGCWDGIVARKRRRTPNVDSRKKGTRQQTKLN